ncbi:MAG TPA: tetratricopeptide repeat protein [Candidatus Sulfotelmatobacter sp.]|nr:tetratricopeptide repeat protein [Candidatus Sulfotelmatobacter sp.]
MSVEIQAAKLRLDLSRYELSRDGRPLKLERQPMELLIFLVQRKGQLITRSDIVEKLWGKDIFVDVDPSINAAVRKIRYALKDDPANPRFLETVIGKGYRYIGDIEIISAPVGPQESAAQEGPALVPKPRRVWAAVISILAAVLLFALFFSNPGWRRAQVRGRRATPEPIHSLAVLPLENLSHDGAQDYLADGITQELITALSKLGALRVISRTSVMRFKDTRLPLPEIARELNVDAVVEGSILQSRHRVRITAQLIQAPQEKQLWAETYDRDMRDVLALQTDVAAAIAKQIKAEITSVESAELARAQQVDPEAYQLYLQGLYYVDKGGEESSTLSLGYFQKAVAKDPSYARGWAGLARAYNHIEDYASAKEAAKRAIALDENMGEGHATLAFAAWNHDLDWTIAEEEFKRAIQLDPTSATPHHGYATYLAALRRHEEAEIEMRRAVELDPLAPLANTNLGSIYWSSHDFDRAVQQLKKALEIDPNFPDAHLYLGMVYESMASYDQALAEFEKCRTIANSPEAEAEIARVHAARGSREEALHSLSRLTIRHKHGECSAYDVALVYAGLGDKDQAFQWLQNSRAEHPSDLLELNDDLRFDSLRSDPRFRDLLRSVNYPE